MEKQQLYTITEWIKGNDNRFLHKGTIEHPTNEVYSTRELALDAAYNMAVEEAMDYDIPEDEIVKYPNAYKVQINETEHIDFCVVDLKWKG